MESKCDHKGAWFSRSIEVCEHGIDGMHYYCEECGECADHHPPQDCTCGHSWEDHHHSCIMYPNVPEEDHKRGICRGVFAEECEATQINGEWIVPEKDRCYCRQYKRGKNEAK